MTDLGIFQLVLKSLRDKHPGKKLAYQEAEAMFVGLHKAGAYSQKLFASFLSQASWEGKVKLYGHVYDGQWFPPCFFDCD